MQQTFAKRDTIVKQNIQTALVLSSIVIVAMPMTAHAYVDPGSGSAIVSAILGVFAAAGYMARKQFYKIKNLFNKSDK